MTFDEFNKSKLNTFTREVTSRVFMDEKFYVGSAYTETFNTQLFQVDNVYKDPGDVWFGEILTDHAIYIPSDFGIYIKTNDDGKDTIMVDHALVTYIESEDDKDG